MAQETASVESERLIEEATREIAAIKQALEATREREPGEARSAAIAPPETSTGQTN